MDEPQNDLIQPDASTDAAPAGDAAPSDPFESGADSFDRAYVEKLRGESASYRTRAKPYEEAFGSYSDQDRAVWMEAAKLITNDPKAGGEYLRNVADALLEQYKEPDPPAPDADAERPLTLAEYRSLRQSEDQQRAQEADVTRIENEAKALGYDVTSHKYTTLLTVASRLKSGSVEEAHQMLQAELQQDVQTYLAAKAAQADGPTPPVGSGMEPSGEVQIRTFQDARRALEARLAAQQ